MLAWMTAQFGRGDPKKMRDVKRFMTRGRHVEQTPEQMLALAEQFVARVGGTIIRPERLN
jgi:hypothetical protein